MSRIVRDLGQQESTATDWKIPKTAKCSAALRGCQGRGGLKFDPYDYEIESRAIYRYLCDACEQQLADDI